MLRCIEKLYQLPVTVQLLQDTGVGRTVNALRKGEGEIALAARTVIGKWKQMVADEEEALENEHAERIENRHSPSSSSAASQHSPTYNNERVSEAVYKNNSSKHEKDKKSDSNIVKIKEEQKKSSHKRSEDNNSQHRDKRNDHSLSKKRRHSNEALHKHPKSQRSSTPSSREDENESNDENGEQGSDGDNTQTELRKSEGEENEYLSEHELAVSQKNSSDDQSDHETSVSKTSHRSSKNSSSLSSDKNKSKHSHDVNEIEKHKHKHKFENSNDNSRHDSNCSKSSSRDRERSKSKSHKESKHSYPSQVEDLHLKYEKLKHLSCKDEMSEDVSKQNYREHSGETNNTEKSSHSGSKSRHSSSTEGHSNHSSKHRKENSKHRSHKSKHTDKEKSDSERSKKSSSKHRDSREKNTSSNDLDIKKETKNNSDSKKRDSKSDKRKEKHSSSRDPSVKSDSKSKMKESTEYVPEAKKKRTYDVCDDGIDGGSGASFAEALGMISPSKSSLSVKKKPSNAKVSPESFGETSFKKQNPIEEGTPSLLQSSTKLTPLPSLTVSVSALPDISPNYVPRPPPKLIDTPFPSISEEEALKVVMNSKNQRTKVFSGNKTIHGSIPSLYELCVFVLQEHINDLEYTGGIPYEIIKPIVDKASPDQLSTLEYYNPYLIEDTGELWELHCKKKFRNKHRQEMESWRDMYMRCSEEQEAKLKSLTANIKLAQDKSQPVRTTKMAYVDSIVKPPRNIARKQALHGTARKAVASPAARVPSLANSTVFNATSAVGVGTSSSSQPVRTSSFVKPKKAPLMLKTLQLIKGRYKR